MQSFDLIKERAEERKGGSQNLESLINDSISQMTDLSALTDSQILAEFSKRIFQTGLNWKVIENKWPAFLEAFHGFDIGRNALMSDDDFDQHLKNTNIVRHAQKILSVRDNAIFISDLSQEYGSAAKFLDEWPADNLIGLWDVMKKRGARLGGTTGQYCLRYFGKDCFILSRSVVDALAQAGVIDGKATSKTALKQVQNAFNTWHKQTGESYTRLSRILAMSVGT